MKAANKELTELIKDTGTGLLQLKGIGPSGAARLLVEVVRGAVDRRVM